MDENFWHFTIGNLVELLTVIGAIVAAIFGIGRKTQSIEEATRDMKEDVAELKTSVKKVGDIVTALAVASARMDMFDKRLDDLVHGRIRIFPKRDSS